MCNYDEIFSCVREENIKKYGTDIDRWGPVLLANRYGDRTHFIYELLQNAEDACERDRKAGNGKKYKVIFKLFNNRLEVRHNGIPFDENDIRGICGLVEGTKSKYTLQIGQFGIGFKSVYAYTKSPEVFSGNYCFCIENYVQPFRLESHDDVNKDETLFIIPFNHNEVKEIEAFSEIQNRLKNLGLRTLLFLKNIDEISWEIDSLFGKYLREKISDKDNFKIIRVMHNATENLVKIENWMVFEKSLLIENKSIKIEIAYLMNNSEKRQIVPAKNAKLVVYFPTDKDTYLKFLIQGPYRTTPSRDNIQDSDWNRKIIEETATLVAESIPRIKEMGLLDINFLMTLPIEREWFIEQESIFKSFFEKVKEKFSGDDKLLPCDEGEYCTSNDALIGTTNLRDLINSEQLKELFNRSKWLSGLISQKQVSLLREYLMKELKIDEIDPEKFARVLSKEFLEKQSDSWMIKLYGFLLEQKALWRKKSKIYGDEGFLRYRPIIRLENGNHVPPFDSRDKIQAYLPSSNKNINELFPTVKKTLLLDAKAEEFLKNLGLVKPDKIAGLIDKIIPIYQKKPITISVEENIQHVKWVSQTIIESPDDERKKNLINTLRKTSFLYSKNIRSLEMSYNEPQNIYLGEFYTGKKDIEIFFEGNEKIWVLDERYKNHIEVSTLSIIGCKDEIQVSYREPDSDGNVPIIEDRGNHQRGLNGFDPDCKIEGLEFALQNINFDKSLIIWEILKKNHMRIHGIVETAKNQNYVKAEKEENFSKIGELLKSYFWLPDKNGQFYHPMLMEISKLPDEFNPQSLESKIIAEKLEFKKNFEDTYLEQLQPEKRKRYQLFEKLIEIMPEEKINGFLEKLIEKKLGQEELDLNSEICEAKNHFYNAEFSMVIEIVKSCQKVANLPQILEKLQKYSVIALRENNTINNLKELLNDPPTGLRTFRFSWNGKNKDAPVKIINGTFLKLNIKNFHFYPILFKEQKSLDLQFPIDNELFYPILEYIIIKGLENHRLIRKLMHDLLNNGQKEPIIVSDKGNIIDGDKRLAAFKVSQLLMQEKKINKSLDIKSVLIVQAPSGLSEIEIREIRNNIQSESQITSVIMEDYKNSLETIVAIKEFYKKGLNISQIGNIFKLREKEVQDRIDSIELMDTFLQNISEDQRYGIGQSLNLNLYFIRLIREINAVEQLDLKPEFKIEMKDLLRLTMLKWFENLLDPKMRINEHFPKIEHIKKMRLVLQKSDIRKTIEKIFEIKNLDKIQIHMLFEDIINHNDYLFSEIEEASLINDKIINYKSKLKFNHLDQNKRQELNEIITESLKELQKIKINIENK